MKPRMHTDSHGFGYLVIWGPVKGAGSESGSNLIAFL